MTRGKLRDETPESNQWGIWFCESALWTPPYSVFCQTRIVMALADDPANVQHRNSVRSPASITWAVWKARGLSPFLPATVPVE